MVPSDLLVYIADAFCDVRARACLSACSREFRVLLLPLLFRGLSLYPGRTNGQLEWYTANMAERLGQIVERLSIRDHKPEYDSDEGSALTDTEDEDAASTRGPVRSKNARDDAECLATQDDIYAAVVGRCPNVLVLRLTLDHVTKYPRTMLALQRAVGVQEFIMRPLRHPQRSAHASPPRTSSSLWPSLTRLRLSDLPGSTSMHHAVALLPQLARLELDACDRFGEWAAHPYTCPLRFLSLRRCSNFSGSQLSTFIGNFVSTLESVAVALCPILPPMKENGQEHPDCRRLSFVVLSGVPFSRSLLELFVSNTGTLDLRLGTVLHPGTSKEVYSISPDPQTGSHRILGDEPASFCIALPRLLREGVLPDIRVLRIMLFPWHQQLPRYSEFKGALTRFAEESDITLTWW